MSDKNNPEAFYAKLKEKLEDSSTWPNEYLYKFIVPSSTEKVGAIEKIFDGMGAIISTKKSSKGKYTSVSIHVKMDAPDRVIEKYKEVGAKVEGVVSL